MELSKPANYLPEMKERMSAKIIVLGNTLVGKTSIICRYVNDTFKENKNQVTIGMVLNFKTITNMKNSS